MSDRDDEKQSAAAAAKPGATGAEVGQRATAAAAEAGAQNIPAGPRGGRTELEVVATRHGMFGVEGPGDTSGFGGLVSTVAMPPASERPYGGWFDEAVDVLVEILTEQGLDPDAVLEKVVVDRGELTIFVVRDHIGTVCRALRDDQDLRFELCLGVSGVHYPGDAGRELHAVYHLFSVTHVRQLRLEVTCPDGDPHVPTVVDVYPGNDWHERETWDLFGIVFDGHPNLARTMLPDDWVGHPQRKDYPLGGIPVEYKGAVVPPPDNRRSYS
ncbi:NADH-quinone oxidoreductase subunit C [Georgenia ruanii]|uniref:NADH-quinone oxidoreductase subunit C n=1 Tax=Georgenia ruanii TaxID=348442 RepID=A0A7J9USG3_9MICO|nr:NADH-quinone oxidoreductase subunit C [Georgenia ruanii]